MPAPGAQTPVQQRHARDVACCAGVLLERGSPLPFLAFFAAYWALVLRADAQGGGVSLQRLLGLSTWLFLALDLWRAPSGWRTRTGVLVVVASAVECACSLGWGLYHYRYHNLPLYVPPGHGLF